jgi:hypothetical protein
MYEIGYHSSDLQNPHVAFVDESGQREDIFDVALYFIDDDKVPNDPAYVESKDALDRLIVLANRALDASTMSISFAGEAYESFQSALDRMRGYGVTITTQNGEVFDAVLVGADGEAEMGDTVLSHEVKNGEDFNAVESYTTPPRSDRVVDVCIH